MPFNIEPLPLPKPLWRPPPSVDPHTQLLAIGDVHGCGRLLGEMMRAFQIVTNSLLAPATHREVVVLGDFIDRGPNSLSVLQALYRSWQQQGLTVLLGNHEALLLDCIDGGASPFDGWLDYGGDACLQSLGVEPPEPWEPEHDFRERLIEAIGDPIVTWLRGLPCTYQSGDFFFCHAGVRPGVALERQAREDLLWIREPFLSSRRYHGKVVVHGHSVEPAICVKPNRIGIDTGAYRSGALTGLLLQGQRAWNVTAWVD